MYYLIVRSVLLTETPYTTNLCKYK